MKLSIENLKHEIIRTVTENQISIIEGKTACGKSTKVPEYLAEVGYRVLVTQPRILATTSLSRILARRLGNKVGFHTGLKSNFSFDSQIIFLTEQSELIRLLAGKETLENTVLIIDEIHENSKYVEILLAFIKKMITNGKKLKLVLMSATLESKKLSEFLYGAPIIKIQSTSYQIGTMQLPANALEDTICKVAKNNCNTLVFLPGKKEISELYVKLVKHFKAYGIRAQILPLHSDLIDEQQKLVFYSYPTAKVILATNIAQTSITISDIDVVVDSGLENIVELREGIPTLVTKHISKADCIQRMGRVGRCRPGFYYLCSDIKYENREEFATPKIQYEAIDDILLTLIRFHIDINSLDFFHKPDAKKINEAIKLLQRLGALNENREITEIGIEMCKFPLNTRAARMLVEAKKYEIESDVLICSLLTEVGSIGKFDNNNIVKCESDLIYELEMFKEVYNNPNSSFGFYSEVRKTNSFKKISEYINKILPILGLSNISSSKSDISKIKKCLICAYSDQLFIFKAKVGYLNNLYSKACSMYTSSLLSKKRHKYVIGQQMNFCSIDGNKYSRIVLPTAYSLDELLESEDLFIFTEKYSNDNGEIYKHLIYNDMEITSYSIGTIEELRKSEPSAFHEETEYLAKFKQTYVNLYYRNLKLSSRLKLI